MGYKVGSVIEVCHGKWTEKYLCTFVGSWGEVHLRKCRLGKTKISQIRFPETIFLKQTAQSKIEELKKKNHGTKEEKRKADRVNE